MSWSFPPVQYLLKLHPNRGQNGVMAMVNALPLPLAPLTIGDKVDLLKSILVSIHGVRDKKERKDYGTKTASDVAFGLIPVADAYECR